MTSLPLGQRFGVGCTKGLVLKSVTVWGRGSKIVQNYRTNPNWKILGNILSVFENWGLRLISPTFYMQLLHVQIPKAQKDRQLKQLFALSGYSSVTAVHKHVDEIDSWWPFFARFLTLERVWTCSSLLKRVWTTINLSQKVFFCVSSSQSRISDVSCFLSPEKSSFGAKTSIKYVG